MPQLYADLQNYDKSFSKKSTYKILYLRRLINQQYQEE